jgi:hypothetical protein
MLCMHLKRFLPIKKIYCDELKANDMTTNKGGGERCRIM